MKDDDYRSEYRKRNERDVWEAREDIRAGSKVGRSVAWRLGVVFLVVLGISTAIGIGAWLFRVGTSDIKGQGEAQIEVNAAGNRLRAQTLYTDLYEGVQASDKKINNMSKNARSEFDRTNIEGAVNVCLDSVAEYNRLDTDVLTSKYRPAAYPARIGDDPSTDCQPDNVPSPSATR